MSGTARVALAKHLALRIAATGLMGARDLEAPMEGGALDESRKTATGSTRLEYRKGNRRVAVDGFLDDRHYISPPSDTGAILMVDRETTLRASVKADDKIGKLQLQGQTWVHDLTRHSRFFIDPELTNQLEREDLRATRVGGMALATRPIGKDFRWAASATFDHESAHVATQGDDVSDGNITISELAVGGQYEHGRVRVDLAGGVAVPMGVDGADPWPEGKLSTKLRAHQDLELTATLGYKGRLPSLRERFDLTSGNPTLGPEFARHAELRAIFEGLRTEALGSVGDPRPRVRVEAAPFTRKTVGTSRLCPSQEQCPDDVVGRLAALDDTFFYGIDLQARIKLVRALEIGGSYSYIKACELGSAKGCDVSSGMMGGADPLDRLPRHRADAWAQFASGRITALARARFYGDALDKGKSVNGVVLGDYPIVEATVSAQLGKEYLGVLRFDDALDVRPETRAGFRTAGRVVTVVFQGTWE
jgi:hypothetical protein